MKSIININHAVFLFPALLILLSNCAQQGGALIGGDKDETPPVVLESTPENYSTNFTGRDFEFVFDEYFELRELKQKLVVSPPMKEIPDIRVKGKKLLIHFNDSLLPGRTYTLNFGDALVDRNEANVLENFKVVFSTGDFIDSLEIYGSVADAFTNEPVEGAAVMLYAGTEDSLPLKEIPLYLSRTNKEGVFSLQNLAEGEYKIFALLDGNNNYKFDMPTEGVAFLDSLVKVGDVGLQTEDSVLQTEDWRLQTEDWRLQTADSLRLRMFKEQLPRQYITGTERKRPDRLQVTFSQALDSLDMRLMDDDGKGFPYRLQWPASRDTIVAWITDSLLAGRDSIIFQTAYYEYDSLEQKVWRTDTLRFNFRHSAAKPEETNPMTLLSNMRGNLELGKPLYLTTGLPYKDIDTSLIILYMKADTLETAEDFELAGVGPAVELPGIDTALAAYTRLEVKKNFLQDSSYILRIMPGAFKSFLGHINDSLTVDFKVRTEDKYGVIVVALENLSEPAILQLLDNKKKTLLERQVGESGSQRFPYLNPGSYRLRLIMDKNANGKWDTGRYLKKIQPEPVIYYGKELSLKANWEMEENWILDPEK